MADYEENQPPEHEAHLEPEDEPTTAQPEQPEDEPKVQAGKREPKTPQSEPRSRHDQRFTVITATITALAGILGAAVGGVASGYYSYMSGKQQAAAQLDANLIKRRQTTYGDYITAFLDRRLIEIEIAGDLKEIPPDVDDVTSNYNKYQNLVQSSVHADYVLSLNDSDSIDKIRGIISNSEDHMSQILGAQYNNATSKAPVDQSALNDFYSTYNAVHEQLQNDFLSTARADVKPPFS